MATERYWNRAAPAIQDMRAHNVRESWIEPYYRRPGTAPRLSPGFRKKPAAAGPQAKRAKRANYRHPLSRWSQLRDDMAPGDALPMIAPAPAPASMGGNMVDRANWVRGAHNWIDEHAPAAEALSPTEIPDKFAVNRPLYLRALAGRLAGGSERDAIELALQADAETDEPGALMAIAKEAARDSLRPMHVPIEGSKMATTPEMQVALQEGAGRRQARMEDNAAAAEEALGLLTGDIRPGGKKRKLRPGSVRKARAMLRQLNREDPLNAPFRGLRMMPQAVQQEMQRTRQARIEARAREKEARLRNEAQLEIARAQLAAGLGGGFASALQAIGGEGGIGLAGWADPAVQSLRDFYQGFMRPGSAPPAEERPGVSGPVSPYTGIQRPNSLPAMPQTPRVQLNPQQMQQIESGQMYPSMMPKKQPEDMDRHDWTEYANDVSNTYGIDRRSLPNILALQFPEYFDSGRVTEDNPYGVKDMASWTSKTFKKRGKHAPRGYDPMDAYIASGFGI